MTDKTALARSIADCDPDLTCAAPELLAALEKALRVYGVDMQPAHRDEFRLAIALARGEQ